MLEGEGAPLQCQRRSGYGPSGKYCKSCTRVWWPEMDVGYELEPLPRAEQKETPWAATLLKRFTTWKTRHEWPVGSVLVRRNNNGAWMNAEGRPVKYGLGEGTADYIGFKSIVVTPEMVGQRLAVFVSIEAKRRGIGLNELQQLWFDTVALNGGIALRAAPETRQDVLDVLNAET